MELFAQVIINGLFLGAIYALVALGYTMVYGILKFINFAHGEVYMVGAFIGYYAARQFGLTAEHPFISTCALLAVSMTGSALLGGLIERFAYRPLRRLPRINVLITAIGVSLFLQYGGQVLFGADPKVFPQIVPNKVFTITPTITVSLNHLITLSVSLMLMVALQYIVHRTKIGKAMRALSDNIQVAELMGIPTDRVITITFLIGSALAGAAGVLIGFSYPRLDPLMGAMLGLKAFVAAVLGGIGSIPGAMVGGVVMGLIESSVSTFGASTYRDAVAFAILILILLFRPAGLFGRYAPEKV